MKTYIIKYYTKHGSGSVRMKAPNRLIITHHAYAIMEYWIGSQYFAISIKQLERNKRHAD